MLSYSVCKQVTHLILLITWLCGWSFIPQEWLATNFSLQYHLWIKCKVHENKRNDHQFKIIQKLLLVGTDGKYREQWGEYAYWCYSVGCKGWKTKLDSTQSYCHYWSDSTIKQNQCKTWITFDAPLLITQCACLLDLKNGWQIISAKKSFAVYAATRTEKAEWMAHINKCIQDLLAKSENERFSYWTVCTNLIVSSAHPHESSSEMDCCCSSD